MQHHATILPGPRDDREHEGLEEWAMDERDTDAGAVEGGEVGTQAHLQLVYVVGEVVARRCPSGCAARVDVVADGDGYRVSACFDLAGWAGEKSVLIPAYLAFDVEEREELVDGLFDEAASDLLHHLASGRACTLRPVAC